MKGKEQSKINGKIVKDLEKHIDATGKVMFVVSPVSRQMNEHNTKGRTETRIASGFRNPESLMAPRKLPLNLVFDVSRSVVSNGGWQQNTFITGVNQFGPNYRRHMATPYGPGSIKSSVSARAARIEGSHARPADIGRHPLCSPMYRRPSFNGIDGLRPASSVREVVVQFIREEIFYRISKLKIDGPNAPNNYIVNETTMANNNSTLCTVFVSCQYQ
ncbi:hypothetical protein ALC57_09468 [Trachymyrmex cornetzi]|uniref:Uncharacterized protein n=1 Tax=Trachymyrmex cornetzi TaxID=471704 RepID=A0A151J5C1_9HYME|nr:hypothetical protein ALC57_09468 [Trachymyrmex cornetzi]